jgi:ABC-2 type transport system permease protein
MTIKIEKEEKTIMVTTDITQGAEYATVADKKGLFLPYYIYCEFLKLIRLPAFILPTLISPVMFFALFGLPNLSYKFGNTSAGAYILISLGSYAMMFTGFITFGAGIASERGLGWNKLLRVSPISPLDFLIAKAVSAIVMGIAAIALLFIFAILVGHVSLPLLTWLQIVGLLVVGMIPFIAIGFALGYIAGPNSAAPIASLIFLPLGFCSGLFEPLQFMPTVVQNIAPYLPSYHAAQLGWTALGAGDGKSFWIHLLWLIGYTVIFTIIAVIAYRRDENKTFG